MPILDVEVVIDEAAGVPSDLAARIADAVGDVFGSPPQRTWVRLRSLPATQYAENGGKQQGVLPVFVSVLKAVHPAPEELKQEIQRLTESIARECARPVEKVHVLYLAPGAGRVAFGGQLVE